MIRLGMTYASSNWRGGALAARRGSKFPRNRRLPTAAVCASRRSQSELGMPPILAFPKENCCNSTTAKRTHGQDCTVPGHQLTEIFG